MENENTEAKVKKSTTPEKVVDKKVQGKTIALLLKNFVSSSPISPTHWQNFHKTWAKGKVVESHEEIEELINLGAPIEVYIQDVNRTAKD